MEVNSGEFYRRSLPRYPALSLTQERHLISQAQKGRKSEAEELVLRHVGFVIFRIRKKAFPGYIVRFGDDLLAQAILILYDKISDYDLQYKDKQGQFKPVRFASYIWKRIDGFIIDFLKKECARQKRHQSADWERFEEEDYEE